MKFNPVRVKLVVLFVSVTFQQGIIYCYNFARFHLHQNAFQHKDALRYQKHIVEDSRDAQSKRESILNKDISAIFSQSERYSRRGPKEQSTSDDSIKLPPFSQLKKLSRSSKWRRSLELLHILIDDGFQGLTSDEAAHAFHCTLTTLGNAFQWAAAVELLQEMPRHHVVPVHLSYQLALRACHISGQWKPGLDLLHDMEAKGILPDQALYGRVIHSCARSKRDKEALHLLEQMSNHGMRVSLKTYNNVLSALAHCGKWAETITLLYKMPKYNLDPDICSFNTAILACERAGEWRAALKTLNSMEQAGVTPDVVSYNTVLSSCNKGKLAHEAIDVFTRMRSRGLQPDIITYNSLISALATRGRWEEAVELLEAVRQDPLLRGPDVVTYNAAIHACANGLQWELALDLVEQMKRTGITPNIYTYNTILHAVSRVGEHVAALDLLQSMHEKGPAPDTITYCSVITACMRAMDLESANSTFQQLRNSGHKVNSYALSPMILALGKAGKPQEALQMFDNMADFNITPNAHVCGSALSVCESYGWTEKALEILNCMEEAKCANAYAYMLAITACEQTGHFKEACRVMEKMRVADAMKVVHTSNILEDSDTVHDRKTLSQWHRSLKLLSGEEPDLETETTYRAAVASCARVGNWHQAKALVGRMKTLGFAQDTLIYGALIGAFEVGGEWQQALKVHDEMVLAGIEEDSCSAASALASCAQLKQGQKAEQILTRTMEAGVLPTRKMFVYYLRSCAGFEEGCSEKVMTVLKLMVAKRADMDELVFVEAMKVCGTRGDWPFVVKMLKEMQRYPFNISPTEPSYFAAIDITESSGYSDEADKILDVGIKAGALQEVAGKLSLDLRCQRDISTHVMRVLTRRVARNLKATLELTGTEQDLVIVTGIKRGSHVAFLSHLRPAVIEELEKSDPPIHADPNFWNRSKVFIPSKELNRWLTAVQRK